MTYADKEMIWECSIIMFIWMRSELCLFLAQLSYQIPFVLLQVDRADSISRYPCHFLWKTQCGWCPFGFVVDFFADVNVSGMLMQNTGILQHINSLCSRVFLYSRQFTWIVIMYLQMFSARLLSVAHATLYNKVAFEMMSGEIGSSELNEGRGEWRSSNTKETP